MALLVSSSKWNLRASCWLRIRSLYLVVALSWAERSSILFLNYSLAAVLILLSRAKITADWLSPFSIHLLIYSISSAFYRYKLLFSARIFELSWRNLFFYPNSNSTVLFNSLITLSLSLSVEEELWANTCFLRELTSATNLELTLSVSLITLFISA